MDPNRIKNSIVSWFSVKDFLFVSKVVARQYFEMKVLDTDSWKTKFDSENLILNKS